MFNLNEAKKIFTNNTFKDTFTCYKTSIDQIEKNSETAADIFLNDIDKRCSKFMSAHDTCYPKQYPEQKGNFLQHYPRAKIKSTPSKKVVDPMFQEREKSDAGKLADKFTELLKKK